MRSRRPDIPSPTRPETSESRCHAVSFNWSCRDFGSTLHVQLQGELDFRSARLASAALRDALSSSHETVVLDMSDVSFIDSSGLSLLIRAKNDVEASRGRLLVSRSSPAVKRIVTTAGLNAWFDPAENRPSRVRLCPVCGASIAVRATICDRCQCVL